MHSVDKRGHIKIKCISKTSPLRRILNKPPTFIDRQITNESIYTEIREQHGCVFEHFGITWQRAKLRLFGHILRAHPSDPLKQVSLAADGLGRGVACDFCRVSLVTSVPVSLVTSQSLPLQNAAMSRLLDLWLPRRPSLALLPLLLRLVPPSSTSSPPSSFMVRKMLRRICP